MKRLFAAAVIFFIITGCFTPGVKKTTPPPSNIKIASFNIESFGNTKISRPNTLTVLAQIALNFDVMAVQEVGSNNSASSDDTCRKIMDRYIARINELKGSPVYSYIRGNQYAIIYRTDRIKVNSHSLYSGSETFCYTPLTAYLQAIEQGTNFDFSMIVIHTSPGLAGTEINSLKKAMDEIRVLYNEPDVICLGDYNADGTTYNEGSGEWLSGFETSLYITGIPNTADTTVAVSDNTYDRIQMTISLNTDFTGSYGVLKFGEIYDVTSCEGTPTTQGTESAISDHYPVWCEYYTDRDTD